MRYRQRKESLPLPSSYRSRNIRESASELQEDDLLNTFHVRILSDRKRNPKKASLQKKQLSPIALAVNSVQLDSPFMLRGSKSGIRSCTIYNSVDNKVIHKSKKSD